MSIEPSLTSAKRSPVEGFKENSRQLRGTLAEELADAGSCFSEPSKQLLKFHGSYQQEDRDARKNRNRDGLGKHYMFMVRCKIPGGKLSAQQYLHVDSLADRYANGTLRLTSRQGIQLHGIVKGDLKATIAGINECLLSTLGACGDVERNVMAPAAPLASPPYAQLQALADSIAEHLAPRSRAYHEIWLNGKPALEQADDPEPIYGKVYLPRKFKTGLALPEDNSTDIYAQDLGFLADVQAGTIHGFDLLVGGGMGMTHGNPSTFPFMGRHICHVRPNQVVDAAEAVVKLFRDHGNRADRKRARIKYVLHDWGVEKFRETLKNYLPFPFHPPKNIEVKRFPLWLGRHEQGDGRFFYGIGIENGRIKDTDACRLRSALRLILTRFEPAVRLTPMQDLLLCDLSADAPAQIESILTDHGVNLPGRISLVRQHSMACPAIPTCGLAISEAERALPGLLDQIEALIAEFGLNGEALSVRMTGCPNGCVRPYQSDLGIVGRSGDKYTIFVGGNVLGTRLNFMLKDLVPLSQIAATLRPLLAAYRDERQTNEGLGDFLRRLGESRTRHLVE